MKRMILVLLLQVTLPQTSLAGRIHEYAANGQTAKIRQLMMISRFCCGCMSWINSKNKEGFSPLFLAARNGHLDTVQFLLIRGAEIDVARIGYSGPLFSALHNNHWSVAQALIRAGANVRQNDIAYSCETPLHIAARFGCLPVVQDIIAAGADLRCVHRYDGYTTLHAAAFNGHTPVVHALIAAGADVQAASVGGETPLQLAERFGRLGVVAALQPASIARLHRDAAIAHQAAGRGELAARSFGWAAIAYFNLGDYRNAAEQFLAAGDRAKAADCIRRYGDYESAATQYLALRDFAAAAQCYQSLLLSFARDPGALEANYKQAMVAIEAAQVSLDGDLEAVQRTGGDDASLRDQAQAAQAAHDVVHAAYAEAPAKRSAE